MKVTENNKLLQDYLDEDSEDDEGCFASDACDNSSVDESILTEDDFKDILDKYDIDNDSSEL